MFKASLSLKNKGLPSKHEALSSNPTATKKKNLRQNNKEQRGRRERDEAGGRGEK
jgi:hypothetical protein